MPQPSPESTATPLVDAQGPDPAVNATGGRHCAPRGHVIVPLSVCDALPTPACQACLQQGCPATRAGPAVPV